MGVALRLTAGGTDDCDLLERGATSDRGGRLVKDLGVAIDFSFPEEELPVLTLGFATSLEVDRARMFDRDSLPVLVWGLIFRLAGRASPLILLSRFLSTVGLRFFVEVRSFPAVPIFRASPRSNTTSLRSVRFPSRAIRLTDSISPDEVRGFLSTKPPFRREKVR